MIKLGVLSDSHGRISAVEQAAEALFDADAVVHLGDCAPDARHLAGVDPARVYALSGNCDAFRDAPEELLLTLGGVRVLCCHGHRYGVKQSMTALSLRAQAAGARLVLYGHTHIADAEWCGGTLFVNPGALMNGRYAVIELRDNGPTPILRQLPQATAAR